MAGSDARRKVPSLDAILRSTPGQRAARVVGRPVLKRTLSTELEAIRTAAADGEEPPIADEILASAVATAARAIHGLTPVINGTGVIIHTNLGRAPLAEQAREAVLRAATGYTDLEVDRSTGARGSRSARAELLLAALTGAEDALVVNNCAAALVLTLSVLAKGKKVLVSRGELIEIGGEFRIPDIMRASGARLVEVGTTNRTRASDFRSAVADAAAILQVHPSNYRVVGFTAAATTAQLAQVAGKAAVPLVFDVGSGLLDAERGFPGEEPTVHQALADGADLVTFSGDKLVGGPQAGCVVGRGDLIAKLRRHPLARAMRVDKLQAAALEATLALFATGAHGDVPVHRMIHESLGLRRGPSASACRGDRRRPRGRARHSVRVGGRRRLRAGTGHRLAGASACGAPSPRPSPPACAGACRRSSAGCTRITCCSTRARSSRHRCRRPPARCSTPWRATTSTTRTDVPGALRVIATAGHVDHGKSALIVALTGIDPDRFAEEKRRGLTIDLGYAWTTLPGGREVGFVDVPGHERFIRNMLAGVGPVRLVLFVVAADEGWKPQSEEHLQILDVLGVSGGVVALTKRDLVDDESLEVAMADTREHLAGSVLAEAPIVPVSAKTGAGLDEIRAALDRMVEAAPVPPDARTRLFVDRVFTISGAGTVVTGTLTGGCLQVDEEVRLHPGDVRARIRSLQSHKRDLRRRVTCFAWP